MQPETNTLEGLLQGLSTAQQAKLVTSVTEVCSRAYAEFGVMPDMDSVLGLGQIRAMVLEGYQGDVDAAIGELRSSPPIAQKLMQDRIQEKATQLGVVPTAPDGKITLADLAQIASPAARIALARKLEIDPTGISKEAANPVAPISEPPRTGVDGAEVSRKNRSSFPQNPRGGSMSYSNAIARMNAARKEAAKND